MARVDKRLDQLEKALGVELREDAITIIEIVVTDENGEKRLLERWDMISGERVYYDQEDKQKD